jgi:hypothetical protein
MLRCDVVDAEAGNGFGARAFGGLLAELQPDRPELELDNSVDGFEIGFGRLQDLGLTAQAKHQLGHPGQVLGGQDDLQVLSPRLLPFNLVVFGHPPGSRMQEKPNGNVLGAALEGRPVGLVGDVSVEDLVYYLQVALVPSLLEVTPEDGLVLFFGGQAAILLPE